MSKGTSSQGLSWVVTGRVVLHTWLPGLKVSREATFLGKLLAWGGQADQGRG